MSKSIDQYRDIIKILKLQLLKMREENAGLSHDLGIASESETSSFTPKINHYKESQQPFAKNILAFLLFAHRCEIIGITPEMVFRIADKKRDKEVRVNSFGQILKRLKLRMSEVEINQLIALIKKDNSIFYESYLQALSAFHVNSQKYPSKGSRTYVQLSLLKFGQQAKSYKDAQTLYLKMNNGKDKPYLSFESYTEFIKRNMPKMEQYQIIAVFVGLDLMSQCQIERSIFQRQVGKVYSLFEKGVKLDSQISMLSLDSNLKSKLPQSNVPGKPSGLQVHKKTDSDYELEEDTGVEAGTKAKKPVKKKKANDQGRNIKLSDDGNSTKVLNELKKLGIRVNQFMQSILNQEQKKQLVKSFTIYDLFKAGKDKIPKKKMMALFRLLDTQKNGTIDTAELIKLWIRSKDITDSDEVLYRLLYRHLREIQYPDPLQRFQVLGIDVKKNISEESFRDVFAELGLEDSEIEKIVVSYIGVNTQIEKFCEELKAEGKPASLKKFTKMDPKVYKEFKSLVEKINKQRNKGKKCQWRKLMRLEDTQEKSKAEDYWEFIFTDEWACWDYCLDVASKLDTFWRDPEFGPSKSDPSGIRSIVGNESDPPPGLPDESQIKWLTFQQILARKKSKQNVNFMEGPINANQVMQGKLGDCWYISSLSIIANKQEYVKGESFKKCQKDSDLSIYGVNPYLFKFFLQYGMYVFKFFKQFEPVYVVVDDLFPFETEVNELLFAKSPNPGMQWPAFLEKAYAKLHHSYSNMISGDIAQGLNDLTNSLPIKEKLEPDKVDDNKAKIQRLNDNRQLMGCSIAAPKGAGVEEPVTLDEQKCGLFYSHAYSIIDYLDLDTKDQHFDLIRVRNPWGHSEWLLDWSDSPLFDNPEYKKLEKYQKDINSLYQVKKKEGKRMGKSFPQAYTPNDDGQFLMNFCDFNSLYTNLFTGFTIESFNANYQGLTISERWDSSKPSGHCKLRGASQKDQFAFVNNNHQYILEVNNDDTDILMYIIQEDGRLYRGEKYPYKELINATLIFVFDIENERQLKKFQPQKMISHDNTFQRKRETNAWNKFKKGRYAIIPCKMKDKIKETDFQFRIYYEKNKKINIQKLKGTNDFRKITETGKTPIDQGQYRNFISLLEKYLKPS